MRILEEDAKETLREEGGKAVQSLSDGYNISLQDAVSRTALQEYLLSPAPGGAAPTATPTVPPGTITLKEIRTPYSLSALPDEVKINAAKHGFFETPDTSAYSLLFGEMQDDPETEIDETEAGIVQQMIEGGQKFSRQQLFNVTSSRRKLNIMQDRLGGESIPVAQRLAGKLGIDRAVRGMGAERRGLFAIPREGRTKRHSHQPAKTYMVRP